MPNPLCFIDKLSSEDSACLSQCCRALVLVCTCDHYCHVKIRAFAIDPLITLFCGRQIKDGNAPFTGTNFARRNMINLC